MNVLKDTIKKLRYVHQYMNQERFNMVFGKFATKYDLKQMFKYSSIGLMTFIDYAPDDMIDAMLAYGNTLEIAFNKHHTYSLTRHPHWRKFIYEQGNEVFEKEINLMDYEGAKQICDIYENSDNILAICRMCDEVELPYNQRNSSSKRIKIYEGDIISTNDEWKGKQQVILCAINEHNITEDSIYYELLYTDKYGYLNQKGEPNEDEEPIRFKESIFNVSDRKYNSYVITMATNYKIIGNITTHLDILRPIGFEPKTKVKHKTKKILR